MVRSMTGFGRSEERTDGISVSVELKSVNHRYFEFSSRVPRGYAFLEDRLKTVLQNRISRGKVDMYVNIDTSELGDASVEINDAFCGEYVSALRKLGKKYKLKNDISVSTVARNSDVFTVTRKAVDEDLIWEIVSKVETAAIDAFIKMRENEGKRLVDDVMSRAGVILEKVAFIEKRSPETVREYREKLEERMKTLLGDVQIDEQRLLTETAIMADKLAVCEETVRLKSHLEQLGELLKSDEPIGRKIDFIVQEMNREANTIGSKAQNVDIARAVVDIKSEIEKIREQIQNIE